MPRKFIATFDAHSGFERKGGHKVPLHDPKAWAAVMKFAQDFKPDTWIHGGDILDCGSISHHNKQKPGNVEGMRLAQDALYCKQTYITPVEAIAKNLIYITGNHEDWLNDLIIATPALDGILNLEKILGLEKWVVIPQGGWYEMGKLTFLHGDTIKGGEHIAKAAVMNWGENVRFGHHHTHQLFTKTSPKSYKNAKTGMAIPCLCTKDPKYGEGAPNRWIQGFLYGYMDDKGFFNDYVPTIIDGRFWAEGKEYKG